MLKISSLALATVFAASFERTAAQVFAGRIPITLVENSWTASALNVAIAKKIIEDNYVDVDVAVVGIPANTGALEALADGSLGNAAILEVWPSSVGDIYPGLEASGMVKSLGGLGVNGQIGWYVPRYVIDQYPEAQYYEFYQKYGTGLIFSTDETAPNGRFISVTPGYSDLDAQIIQNLQMPFTQVFSGGEGESVALLADASANNEPILMYWWSPTSEVAFYNLTRVELPPVTQFCLDSIQNADGFYDCDYPADPLFKVVSASLEDMAPGMYRFLEAFTITDDIQLELIPRVDFGGETVEAVAFDWVINNRAVWEPWVYGEMESSQPTEVPSSAPSLAPSSLPPTANETFTANETVTAPPPTAGEMAPPPTLDPIPAPPSGGFHARIDASFVSVPLLALLWSALL